MYLVGYQIEGTFLDIYEIRTSVNVSKDSGENLAEVNCSGLLVRCIQMYIIFKSSVDTSYQLD